MQNVPADGQLGDAGEYKQWELNPVGQDISDTAWSLPVHGFITPGQPTPTSTNMIHLVNWPMFCSLQFTIIWKIFLTPFPSTQSAPLFNPSISICIVGRRHSVTHHGFRRYFIFQLLSNVFLLVYAGIRRRLDMINYICHCQNSIIISAESRWKLQDRNSFWWVINYSNQVISIFPAFSLPHHLFLHLKPRQQNSIEEMTQTNGVCQKGTRSSKNPDIDRDVFLCDQLSCIMREEKFHWGGERWRPAVGRED